MLSNVNKSHYSIVSGTVQLEVTLSSDFGAFMFVFIFFDTRTINKATENMCFNVGEGGMHNLKT